MHKLPLNRDEQADVRRQQVISLYNNGFRQTEIADRLGITQARVSQILLTITRKRINKRQMLRLMPADGASA